MESNKVLGIVIGVTCTVTICAGVASIVAYVIKENQKTPNPDDEKDTTPNINDANLQYSSTKQEIYERSVPVMISITRQRPYRIDAFLNGTAWVFDREIDINKNLVTYYLATNLHVINLWEDANSPDKVYHDETTDVALFLGNKNIYDQYSKDTAKKDYYKWKYLKVGGSGLNLKDWYGSNMSYNWPTLKDNDYTNPTTNYHNKWVESYEYRCPNGGFSYELIPYLGIDKNVDLGIIKIDVEKDRVQNYPFFEKFDNLIQNKSLDQIYNLDQNNNQKLKISIAGYPVMTDGEWNYSAFNTWSNADENNFSKISLGNGGRGNVTYQTMKGKFQSEAYYGNASNANLNHGSSGSMVVNNETNLIEGIYWGGLQNQNDKSTFYGRFVPFAANGILEAWSKFVVENYLPKTFISNYFTLSRLNKNVVNNLSLIKNNFIVRFLTDYTLDSKTIRIPKR